MKIAILRKCVCVAMACQLALPSFAFADEPIIDRNQMQAEIKQSIQENNRRSLSEISKAQREALNCGPNYVPLAELSSLAITCWDMKKSKESDPDLTEEQILAADKAICTCLGESTHVAVKTKMLNSNIRAIPEASFEAVKNFRDNVNLAQKRLQDLQNGMMFQASILSESEKNFMLAYSQGQMRKALAPIGREKGTLQVSEIGARMKESYVKSRGFNQFTGLLNSEVRQSGTNIVDGVEEALNSLTLPPANTNLLTNPTMAPGQCVSAREYLSYKQIPSPHSTFYSGMTAKNYHPTDWNYTVLQGQLKSLETGSEDIVKSRQKDIQVVRERMEFLNRNPMFKSFFMVNLGTNEAYFKSAKIDPEEQNKIINNPGWTNLDSKKEELFKIIQGLDPKNKNNVEAFRKKATAFFKRPEVGYLTNLEVQKQMYREFDQLQDPKNLMPAKLPSTQQELEAKFAENTRYISPAECNKGGANVEKCVDSYAAYCRLLSDAEKQMNSTAVGADTFSADVTFENMDNFDPNINTNPDFKKFNDRICNSRRKSKNPTASDSKTFFDFKKEYCGRNQDTACTANTPEAFKKLRETYFKSYGELEVSSNKEEDRDTVASFNSVNEAMNSNKVMNAEEAQSVANNESTPEQSRNLLDRISDYFGGKGEDKKSDSDAVVAVPTSEEGSTFSSFAKGMESLAGNMGAGPNYTSGDEVTPVLPSSVLSSTNTAANDDHKLSDDEKDKIKAQAEDEIAKSKREIAAATSAAQKESLETRMKLMEELLAQKTENEAKYQKLLDQLSKKTDEKSVAAATAVAKAEAASNRKQNANTFQASNDFDSFEEQRNNRAPASVSDNGSYGTSGGTGGGSNSSSSGGSARVSSTSRGSQAAANFNTALLEAQEAKTGKIQRSSDGSIVIASDSDSPALKSLSNAANGADYSLSVPAADYAGFENQSVETLKRYQEKLISSMDANQPVRVFVKSDKKEPLEFYVVKEGSKLFFKPVRKSGATLEALKMAVKKNP